MNFTVPSNMHNGLPNGTATSSTSEASASSSGKQSSSLPVPEHNAQSGTSTPTRNGYPLASLHAHDQEIVDHLYQSGFQTGNYADTIVSVHQNAYRLHAIILSRSPYLAHLMSTSPQNNVQRSIHIDLEQEPEVTQDGIAIALGYLYSSVSLNLVRPENARGVLAAGVLLGGIDELCQHAYQICRQSITVDTLSSWLKFIEPAMPIPSSPTNGSPAQSLPPSSSIFGQYAERLREDVFNYLVVELPDSLALTTTSSPSSKTAGSNQENGRETLLQVYSHVPFDMFKAAIESPSFQLGSDQTRFKFAKDCIEIRKRGIARGTGIEETVVLAFGRDTASGSAVHVTRKMRKRALWKVNS